MDKRQKQGLFHNAINSINDTLNTFHNSLHIINTELDKNLVESQKKLINTIMMSPAPKEIAKEVLDIDLTDEHIEQWHAENIQVKEDI